MVHTLYQSLCILTFLFLFCFVCYAGSCGFLEVQRCGGDGHGPGAERSFRQELVGGLRSPRNRHSLVGNGAIFLSNCVCVCVCVCIY